MTCIVGIEHDGKVYMGGDSAAVSGYLVQTTDLKKVFRISDMLIGYTSSFRMGQLLEYNLNIPDDTSKNDLEYLVKQFIPAVRECLKGGAYTTVKDNQEEGGEFLVGYHGKIYKVASDFQVNRFSNGIAAAGSGEEYALGALVSMFSINPEESVKIALGAAGTFSKSVCPPYYVLSL